jgi:Flp pilus assembly protein TadD
MHQRKPGVAVAHYSQAVTLKPNDPYARKCLAYALVAAGYASHGAQQMELALGLAVPSIEDLCFAGNAWAQAGDYAKAIKKYQLAAASDDTNANVLVGLAEVEKKAGMVKEARAAAAKALPLALNEPELKRRAMNVLSEEKPPQQLPQPTEQSQNEDISG